MYTVKVIGVHKLGVLVLLTEKTFKTEDEARVFAAEMILEESEVYEVSIEKHQ